MSVTSFGSYRDLLSWASAQVENCAQPENHDALAERLAERIRGHADFRYSQDASAIIDELWGRDSDWKALED